MARGEFFATSFWDDPEIDALSAEATLLYIWSWTNSRCNMAGLYTVVKRRMSESKVPERRLDGALEELHGAELMHYHESIVWVVGRVKHLRNQSPNIAKSIARDVENIPAASPLRVGFLYRYGGEKWLAPAFTEGELVAPTTEDVANATNVIALPFSALESRKPEPPGRGFQAPSKGSNATATASAVEEQQPQGAGNPAADEPLAKIPEGDRPLVEPVLAALARIAAAKPGAVEPTLAAVARTLLAYPGKDWLQIAEDMEHWLLYGTGQSQRMKDVVQGYRNQLKRQPDVSRKSGRSMKDAGRPVVDHTAERLRRAEQ